MNATYTLTRKKICWLHFKVVTSLPALQNATKNFTPLQFPLYLRSSTERQNEHKITSTLSLRLDINWQQWNLSWTTLFTMRAEVVARTVSEPCFIAQLRLLSLSLLYVLEWRMLSTLFRRQILQDSAQLSAHIPSGRIHLVFLLSLEYW